MQMLEGNTPVGHMLGHLQELARRLRRILAVVLVAVAFFFITGPANISVRRTSVTLPLNVHLTVTAIPVIVPTFYRSFSSLTIRYFVAHELPKGMTLINVNPFDPVLASVQVSLFFGIFIATPFIISEMWKFISPALYETERKNLKWAVVPAMILFVAGALFAYIVVIPILMVFIKFYSISLGVTPTLSIKSFINVVIGFMFSFGLSFETPLIMITLSKFGFVSADTWKKNWRYGILGSFVIALILSPGATGGLIESLIGITLSSLYIAGALIAARLTRSSSTSGQLKDVHRA